MLPKLTIDNFIWQFIFLKIGLEKQPLAQESGAKI